MAAVDITLHCEVGGQVGADVESQVKVGVGADVESQVKVGVESQVKVGGQVGADVESQVKVGGQVGADVESQVKVGVEAGAESQGESGADVRGQFRAKTTKRDLRKRVIERWRRHLPLRVRFGNVTPQTLADGSLGPGPEELTGVLFDIREKTIISPYELVGCVAVINPFNFVDKSFQYYASADALELLPKADQRFEFHTVSMFSYFPVQVGENGRRQCNDDVVCVLGSDAPVKSG